MSYDPKAQELHEELLKFWKENKIILFRLTNKARDEIDVLPSLTFADVESQILQLNQHLITLNSVIGQIRLELKKLLEAHPDVQQEIENYKIVTEMLTRE